MTNISHHVICISFILFVYLALLGRMDSITTAKDVSTQTGEKIANNDALVDEEPEEQRHILANILGKEIFSFKIRI